MLKLFERYAKFGSQYRQQLLSLRLFDRLADYLMATVQWASQFRSEHW